MNRVKRVLVITKNDFRERMDGGSKRTAALIDALANDGWTVDWVAAKPYASHAGAPRRSSRTARLKGTLRAISAIVKSPSLSSLKWFSVRTAAEIGELSESNDYGVVIIEHTQMSIYAGITHPAELIIDMHNIESELLSNYSRSEGFGLRGLAARIEACLMRRIERKLADGDAAVVTVSDHDAARLQALVGRSSGPIIVAPNGIDEEFFRVEGTPDNNVVFIGHLGWRPNVDGATWLSGEVWPKVAQESPHLQLHLIGRNPSSEVRGLTRDTVHVFANVPSVIPHLATAACATAPLLSAGGTRIKILEALAAGVPVVATKLGALGLEHLASEHFVVTDNPDSFADNVRRLSERSFDRDSLRAGVMGFGWWRTLAPVIEEANRRYIHKSEPQS